MDERTERQRTEGQRTEGQRKQRLDRSQQWVHQLLPRSLAILPQQGSLHLVIGLCATNLHTWLMDSKSRRSELKRDVHPTLKMFKDIVDAVGYIPERVIHLFS